MASPSTLAAGDCTVSATDQALDSEEQAMLTLINNYRAQNGLGPLALSPTLTRAAAWHSHDMATRNYASHTDSLGRAFNVRLRDCGYAYSTVGENIAAGSATAQGTFTQWRNSSPHNAAMLNGSFRAAGIGRAYNAGSTYGWYWTLTLGGVVDAGSTAPTPTPQPSAAPTPSPTATPAPTHTPTPTPTASPRSTCEISPLTCGTPNDRPSTRTGATPAPTPTPTIAPTAAPTAAPTPAPTAQPVPTATPTSAICLLVPQYCR